VVLFIETVFVSARAEVWWIAEKYSIWSVVPFYDILKVQIFNIRSVEASMTAFHGTEGSSPEPRFPGGAVAKITVRFAALASKGRPENKPCSGGPLDIS